MLFDYWVSRRMEFTTEEKRECLETAKTIIDLAQKVRNGGIMALETEIDAVSDILLKKALRLIIDGIQEDEIRGILQTWIIAGNYRGRRLFKRLLILDGMMALQRGNAPEFIRNATLASHFGEVMLPEYNKYFEKG